MSYNDTYPATRTGTTPLGRVSKTVSDGFGRVTKSAVRKSTGPEVWIVTETQYSACSCSTTGKALMTSRPYLANSSLTATETVYWTESRFDALGRTTKVLLPAAPNTQEAQRKQTTYDYSIDASLPATSTEVTEPGGKKKSYRHDAFGRLVRVYEPLTSSTLVESARYNYDAMGRMTKVCMGKLSETPGCTQDESANFKQTRTFTYNTKGQLLSANNPENGTVNYTYRADGLLQSKQDQKQQPRLLAGSRRPSMTASDAR